MNKIIRQFANKIRQIRLAQSLSQGDVAEKLGVHRTYISGLERGTQNPSLLTLHKIAKALKVKVGELIK